MLLVRAYKHGNYFSSLNRKQHEVLMQTDNHSNTMFLNIRFKRKIG